MGILLAECIAILNGGIPAKALGSQGLTLSGCAQRSAVGRRSMATVSYSEAVSSFPDGSQGFAEGWGVNALKCLEVVRFRWCG